MSSASPFNISLKPSNESIVRGCPGVQRSFPRVEGVLEIRSNNGIPVLIRKITASLVNNQEISVPSSAGIGSTSASRSFSLFTAGIYGGSEEILGADIPFILPISQEVIASGEISKYAMVNKSYVRFAVTYGNSNIVESNYEFPVPIMKYNTLPIYRQFSDPGVKMVDSPDRTVLLEYSIPRLSFGPSDVIEIFVKMSIPSSRTKKVKLKRASLELREIIEFHDGGFQDRSSKVAFTQKDFSNAQIVGDGMSFEMDLKCPSSTLWNEMTNEKGNPSAMKHARTPKKINPEVPLSHNHSFTIIGKLFSVRYELILKTKLSHAKDIEAKQQLIISPFDTATSIKVLKWILNESELTASLFGQSFESNLDAALKRAYNISDNKLTIYRASSIDDWVKLGLGERAVKTKGKVLDYYID